MSRRPLAGALALVLGCGDNFVVDPPDVVEKSGTRLRLAWWQADGARQVKGFFDLELGAECTFEPWVDGELYCTPLAVSGPLQFADPDCTMPLAAAGLGQTLHLLGAPRHHATSTLADADCRPRYRIEALHELGERLYPERTYRLQNGQCIGPEPASGPYYRIGRDISPSDLVRGRLAERPRTFSIVPKVIETDDGAVLPRGFRATAGGFDCEPVEHPSTGALACVPVNEAHDTRKYTDATCTAKAAEIADACEPATVVLPSGPQCDFAERRALAAKVEPYAYNGSTCDPVAAAPGRSYAALGDVVPLPALAREHGAGARLRTSYLTTVDGLSQHAGLFDTTLGIECSFLPAHGVGRCLPLAVASLKFGYIDSFCHGMTAQVHDLPPFPGCNLPANAPAFVADFVPGSNGPIAGYRVYRVFGPQIVWQGTGPFNCRRIGGATYTAASVPLDLFAAADVVIDL